MYDPSYPDEWGPWELADPRDSFETRKAADLVMFERRCRHCKHLLAGIPIQPCQAQECQALNVIGGYEPISFRTIKTQVSTFFLQAYKDRGTRMWDVQTIEGP